MRQGNLPLAILKNNKTSVASEVPLKFANHGLLNQPTELPPRKYFNFTEIRSDQITHFYLTLHTPVLLKIFVQTIHCFPPL